MTMHMKRCVLHKHFGSWIGAEIISFDQQLCKSWRLTFKVSKSELRCKVIRGHQHEDSLPLYTMTLQLCVLIIQLRLGVYILFKHIVVESHRRMCLFGVCS